MGKKTKQRRNKKKKEKQIKYDALEVIHKYQQSMPPEDFAKLLVPSFDLNDKYPDTIKKRLARAGVSHPVNIPKPDADNIMQILSLRATL